MKSIKLSRYPLSIATAVVIWIVCMIPVPETPLADVTLIDKWTHLAMYGGTTAVFWLEYWHAYIKRSFQLGKATLIVLTLVMPTLLGGLIELLQAYCTTHRGGDWLDFAANATGVTLATALALHYMRYANTKQR